MDSAVQQQQPNYAVLRAFTFSFFMIVAIITSYFPLYFQSQGYSAIQIGLLYSIGPMIGIVSNLFWGYLSDKYRTVKKILTVILAGQFLMALLVFHSSHITMLMLMMVLFFFFQSPNISLTDSLTLLTVSGRNKSYASFRVWGSIGFAAAALVFGMLLKQYGIGLTVPLCLGTIAISLVFSLFLTDTRTGSFKQPDFRILVKIISTKKFLLFLLTIMVISVAHRFNDGFLALFLKHLGADQTFVGWAWMIAALGEVPVFFFLSRYGHRYKELPLLVVCAFVYALRFALMSQIDNPIWVIGTQALHSISFGIFLFTAIRYIGNVVPDEYRSTGQAIFAVTWSGAAGLLSGLLGGWLYNAAGPHVMYGVGAVLSLIGMLSFLLQHVFGQER